MREIQNSSLYTDPWTGKSAPLPTAADAAPLTDGADRESASELAPGHEADAATGQMQADAWSDAATTTANGVAADPWADGASVEALPGAAADAGAAWLNEASDMTAGPGGASDLATLWQQLLQEGLPVHDSINAALAWVVTHLRPAFQTIRAPIDATLTGVTNALLALPALVLIGILALLAWQFAGRRLAVGTVLALLTVALLGIWSEAMVTLALVLTALLFCVLLGLPLGILLASSDRAQRWTRPLLDAMQTTPAFVYLVPVVMLFGIGNVPGVIVTIVFALPPLVRLTNLGIRQVRPDLIEASRAYGASPLQLLWKVQLPLAMPSIMAGINQALMLSLSMVVIASMIAVGGLGQMVLRGIGRLDMGLATVGGLGIVLLAIVLDRITQAMGDAPRGGVPWWQTGPAGWLWRQRRKQTRSTDRASETARVSPSAQTGAAASAGSL